MASSTRTTVSSLIKNCMKSFVFLFTVLFFANNHAYGQVSKDYQHWADGDALQGTTAQWQGDILSANKSDYFEGEVIPHVFVIQASNQKPLTNNQTYSFTIIYNYWQKNSNAGGFKYITRYNKSRTTDTLPGISSNISPVVAVTNNGGIQGGDFYASTGMVQILTVSAPQPSGSTSVDQTVTVTFKYIGPTTKTGLIAFYYGLYIAPPGNFGGVPTDASLGITTTTNGAHFWTGGSLQTTVNSSFTGALSLQLAPSAIIAGTISGYKFKDVNNNGAWDKTSPDNEPPLQGWTIYLDNDNDSTNGYLFKTVTDATGYYFFSVTPDADKNDPDNDGYYVYEAGQANWTQTFPKSPNNPYYGPIVISATNTAVSNQNFGNFLCVAPTIATNPGNATVCSNATVSFTASASGTPTPSYKWQVLTTASGASWADLSEASPYSGVTSGTLTINPVTTSLSGYQYRLVATNTCNSANSTAATLTVNEAPTITVDPTDATVCATVTATFNATVTGTPAPTYQWQELSTASGAVWTNLSNGSPYSGVTTASLSISPTSTSLSGYKYRLIASNSCGKDTSAAAVLTVNIRPSITLQPRSRTVCSPDSVHLEVTASGTPAPAYQWQVKLAGQSTWSDLSEASPYSGTQSNTLVINPTATSLSGNQYQLVATNSCGSAISSAATLTVNNGPTISLNPTDATVCATVTATFTASATGTPTPAYQWQVLSTASGATWTDLTNSSPYSGVTTGTLSISPTTTSLSGYQFKLKASNGCSTVYSAPATLIVNIKPSISVQPVNRAKCVPDSAHFTVTASGTPAPAYQWQVKLAGQSTWSDLSEASPYSGTQSNTLVINPTAKTMSGNQYQVVITNSCGSVTSNPATLTASVTDVPMVTYVPPACDQSTFTVRVKATAGSSYTLRQSTGGVAPITKTYAQRNTVTDSVEFTGLTVGKGYSVTETASTGCTSAANECGISGGYQGAAITLLQTKENPVVLAPEKTTVQPVETYKAQIESSPTRVTAAPNPFNDRIRFLLQSAVSGQGSLELFNMAGQRVKTVFRGYVEKGQVQTIEYNVPGAQRANMVYVFTVGDQKVSGKLIGIKQ